MADIVPTLFGFSPEMYQRQQQQRADDQAMAFARLSPIEKASFGVQRGAYGLAGAIGGMLGGQDPELQRITMRQQIAGSLDPSDLSTFQKAFAALAPTDPEGAMMVRAELEKVQMGQAKLASENALTTQRSAAAATSQAQTDKIKLSTAQEAKLRDELSTLGPNATEDQIRGVMVKYGDPDQVLTALTSAATRAEDRASRERLAKEAADARVDAAKLQAEARVDAAKLQAEARIDAAREAGATRLQIAQLQAENSRNIADMQAQNSRNIAEMQAQNKRDLAELAASLKGPKVLPPALQKEEDKDLELVDSLAARSGALQPAVASLTPDPVTKKAPLALGPINNLRYQALNAAGNSTPESRAYAQLQRSVQEAINLKTDAAKGVQTDKDVLRFANTLIAAFGKNDTQTTLDALSNFVEATDKARTDAQKRINSRRKSQRVEPYYDAQAGTPQNPIKLD